MSRLDELITELCPDGVEYRKLKDVTEMQRGTSLTKKNATECQGRFEFSGFSRFQLSGF